MRYCPLLELAPGMTLGRHIHGFNGDLLLAQGKQLDDRFIVRLKELGFPGAYIDEAGFEAVQPPEILDGALRHSTETLLLECFEKLTELTPTIQSFDGSLDQSMLEHQELTRVLPMGKIRDQVNVIVKDILDQYTHQLPCLLLKAQSRYQVQHSMDTMLVAILLGVNFRFIYRELRQLALAALLHDVGKSLLTSSGESNIGPDHPKYKEHPIVGGMIILRSGEDLFTECATVQQHHERQDGEGFPYGLRGEGKSPIQSRSYHTGTIYRLAEIVSVADAYDVLTSGAFAPALSPENALKNLIKRMTNEFNPHVVKALVKAIQIFPIGCSVRIVKCSNEKLINSRGIVSIAKSEFPHQCELILTHDGSGQRTTPLPITLVGDEAAQLDLVI
jgi:HD-GYP domain-containing protein (c-di-GMP phosphodiesterase class II)